MANIGNNTALIDNSRFRNKNNDPAIRKEYADKWLRAFLTTGDPYKWLQRRNHSKKILATI